MNNSLFEVNSILFFEQKPRKLFLNCDSLNSPLQQYAPASGITVFGAHFSFIYNLTFLQAKKKTKL